MCKMSEEKGIKEEERKEKFGEFLEEIVKTESTKEERKRVAESYKKYLKALTKSDRDTYLVFLDGDKKTAVKRADIPKLMEDDEIFYARYRNLFKKRVTID